MEPPLEVIEQASQKSIEDDDVDLIDEKPMGFLEGQVEGGKCREEDEGDADELTHLGFAGDTGRLVVQLPDHALGNDLPGKILEEGVSGCTDGRSQYEVPQ